MLVIHWSINTDRLIFTLQRFYLFFWLFKRDIYTDETETNLQSRQRAFPQTNDKWVHIMYIKCVQRILMAISEFSTSPDDWNWATSGFKFRSSKSGPPNPRCEIQPFKIKNCSHSQRCDIQHWNFIGKYSSCEKHWRMTFHSDHRISGC